MRRQPRRRRCWPGSLLPDACHDQVTVSQQSEAIVQYVRPRAAGLSMAALSKELGDDHSLVPRPELPVDFESTASVQVPPQRLKP